MTLVRRVRVGGVGAELIYHPHIHCKDGAYPAQDKAVVIYFTMQKQS